LSARQYILIFHYLDSFLIYNIHYKYNKIFSVFLLNFTADNLIDLKYTPSYIELYATGELKKRVAEVEKICSRCSLCPHQCCVDRRSCFDGYCRSNLKPVIAFAGPHFGEEPPLVGHYGSGTIFFTNCNLKCIYCQNCDISQLHDGKEITYDELASVMVDLQQRGYLDESKEIINFIAGLSKNIYLNIMDQYRPEYRAVENSNLTRRITGQEHIEILSYAREKGLSMIDS